MKTKVKTITLQEAKTLQYGEILYHTINRNADGTPQRWKVNGKVKTWKRDVSRVKVPLKHGLYMYDYLDEDTLGMMTKEEEGGRG